jgi:uncharacterized protein HemX
MLPLALLGALARSAPPADERATALDTPAHLMTPDPTPAPATDAPSSSSAGSIAGIVFAALVFVGLIAGGVVWYVRNKDTQDQEIRARLDVATV